MDHENIHRQMRKIKYQQTHTTQTRKKQNQKKKITHGTDNKDT